MMDARALARELGGDATGPHSALVPGPGHSPRDRSLSVRITADAPDGFIVHSFAGDCPFECRDYIRDALGLPAFGSLRPVRRHRKPPQARPADDTGGRQDAAKAIWQQTVEITGTTAERYLRGRGLTLDLEECSDLRFHGALRLEGEATPAMVALMRDAITNEPCGIHRTFLTRDGKKLDRRMLGRARGAVVKLSANEDVTTGLGLAEGIETALSVLQAGWAPVWACLSAGTIEAFPVLSGIEALTVFADHDENGRGDEAARACCVRWIEAGREALAVTPIIYGDWNDVAEVAA